MDHARRAVAAGGGFPAALLLARALIVTKRFDEAEALLATLEDDVPDRWAALGYIWERGVNVLCWGLKRPDAARALIERAMAWEGGTPDWHRLLAPMRLTVTALTDGWEALVALGEEILADPALDPEVRRQLIYGQAGGLFFVGRTADAMALADEVEIRVPLRDDFDDQTLIIQAAIRLESGRDWDGLERRLEQLEREAVGADDRLAAASTAMMLAGLSVQRGTPAADLRWAHEAVRRLERRDRAGLLTTAYAITAMLCRVAGDAEGAIAAAARMERELGGDEPLINQLPYVICARACRALMAGDAREAQRILVAGVDQFPEGPGYRTWFRFEAVRAGADPRAHATSIASAAALTDAPLAAAQARHVVALAAGDGAELLEAGADFAAIGGLLWAAESAGGAAAAFAAQGREDSARRAVAQARRLLEACGAAPTPPLAAVGAQDDVLTVREREIVALAAAGAGNAEIAARLVLSVRTVETHLYRAMQKLGVGSRADLG
jgi:DNA-binding CsgD family transcriptional regulator